MHAQVLCILRVFMFVSLYLLLMWFVSCLSSVLLWFFLLYLYRFRSQFSVVGGILFTDDEEAGSCVAQDKTGEQERDKTIVANPKSIKLERKYYLDCSLDTLCTRGEFGRVTYWLQTLRSWRRWTHRKSTRKDSMRKR